MRILRFTLAAIAMSAASSAFAAGTSAAPHTPAPPPPATAPVTTPATNTAAPKPDYAAQCTALGGQWQTAMAANATNKNLGKATAKAEKAKTACASTKASDQKKGVAGYQNALKLLGVTPS